MKKLIFTSIAVYLVFLASGCAEKRPLKELEPNRYRLPKASICNSDIRYFKETITKSDLDATDATVGNLGSSRLVKFKCSEKYLTIYNVNKKSEDFMKKSSQSPFATEKALGRFRISKYIDIRKEKDANGDVTNKMIETEEDRSWDKREYVIVDFTSEEILDRGNYYEGYGTYQDEQFLNLSSAGEVTELQINNEIINITFLKRAEVNRNSEMVNVRYSFMPIGKSDYKEKLLTEEMNKKMGFFTQEQQVIDKNSVDRDKVLVTRRDPNKKVVYYLSKNWSVGNGAKYKHVAERAVKEWNKVFKQTLGVDNFIELRESDGSQRLGDLRYNMLEWIEEPFESVPLGFGPSINNPFTGEIVNADAMIYGGAILRNVWFSRDMKKHELEAKEELSKNKIDRSDQLAMAEEFKKNQEQTYRSSLRKTENSELNSLIDSVKSNKLNVKEMGALIKKGSYATETEADLNKHSHHGVEGRDCSQLYDRDNMAIALSDAVEIGMSDEEFIERFMLFAIIHEMGHNFGLRHNFRGSIDKKNFYDELNPFGELKYQQASIMDYSDDVGHMLDRPGKYDVAAMDILYKERSKEENLAKIANFNYEFCTDQHVNIDPLCNRFDKGTTPYEVSQNIAESYRNNYKLRNETSPYRKRFYTESFDARYYFRLKNNYFLPMRTFIDYKNRNNLKGAEWDKAINLSVDFFLSALFNSHESNHKMDENEEVTRIGTALDRMLAIHYLTMESVSSELGSGYYGGSGANYFDYMQTQKGRENSLVDSYRYAIYGEFPEYDLYNGVNEGLGGGLMLQGLRAFAFYRLMNISGSSNFNIPYNFSFEVIDGPYLVDKMISSENSYLKLADELNAKFLPIVEEKDFKSVEEVIKYRDMRIMDISETKKIISGIEEDTVIIQLLNKYIENLKILSDAKEKPEQVDQSFVFQTCSVLENIRKIGDDSINFLSTSGITAVEYAKLIEQAKVVKRFSSEELAKREEILKMLVEYEKQRGILVEQEKKFGIDQYSNYFLDDVNSRLIVVRGTSNDKNGRFINALVNRLRSKKESMSEIEDEEYRKNIQFFINEELLFIYKLHDIYKEMMPGFAK